MNKILFRQFCRDRSLTKKSELDYRREIDRFEEYMKKPVCEAVQADVEIYARRLRKLIESGKYRKSTIEKMYSYLQSYGAYIEERGSLVLGEEGAFLQKYSNPFITYFKTSVGREISSNRILSKEELFAILRASEERKLDQKLMIGLMIYCALKPKQVLNLKWSMIIIDGAGRHGIVLKDPKKSFSLYRKIPDAFAEELYHFKALSKPGSNDSLVFINQESKKPYSYEHLRRLFKSIVAAAGIEESTRLMDLRHTVCTAAMIGGLSASELKEIYGWSSVVYANRYANIVEQLGKGVWDYIEA